MTDPQKYRERLTKLQAKLAESDLPAFLVTAQDSIYYLTGVTYVPLARPFFLVVKPDAPVSLLVPALDREHLASAPNVGSVSSCWDIHRRPPSTALCRIRRWRCRHPHRVAGGHCCPQAP